LEQASQDGMVGIVTRVWDGSWVRILVGARDFLFSEKVVDQLWGSAKFLFSGYHISFPGIKQLEC